MSSTDVTRPVPRGDRAGFVTYFRSDVTAGFLVFLIALPLCLGISVACGFPPIAGIFTAILGAAITTFLSNSELTIKGPAAGLIVIIVGCIEDFGGDGVLGGFNSTDMSAYRMALAVGTAAALLQIAFGLGRAGILGDFFPAAAVHGMLAAIGVIIIAKQIPVALGVEARGEPLELLWELPHIVLEANPAIALIGVVSMAVMFSWPRLRRAVPWLNAVPAPLIVLVIAVPLGMFFDLMHQHSYFLQGHKYQLGEQYLVTMPDRPFGMFQHIVFPDYSALALPKAWKWVLMFFIVGSLESLLSTKAVDLIDPWRRKTNLDRDMTAVGIANLACSLVGGLPMISEIVRSKANIDNGARTRFADLWHGVFLLLCVALIPTILHRIPLAALASMLVYTGYRLAHPSEFLHVYHIGREQLIVFVVTLIGVLATDLLIGVALGIAVKLVIHVANGVPLRSLFRPSLDVSAVDERTVRISLRDSAVFSNWIPFRRELEQVGLLQGMNVVVDLTDTQLVDHSVMDKLAAMQHDFAQRGLSLTVTGLELHRQFSPHEHATRKRGLARIRRLTVTGAAELEPRLAAEFIGRGATGYTSIPCTGIGRRQILGQEPPLERQFRMEVILPKNVCDDILAYLRREILPSQHVTACVEVVDVVCVDAFVSESVALDGGLESAPARFSSNGNPGSTLAPSVTSDAAGTEAAIGSSSIDRPGEPSVDVLSGLLTGRDALAK